MMRIIETIVIGAIVGAALLTAFDRHTVRPRPVERIERQTEDGTVEMLWRERR